ncbi:hypothetical protein FF098_011180 [Parvularcula flava]|uniref:Uncharacterized protein n=1 Tax=Aquisalinus luteolus TaxID=1566827 RepID=A0A8J3A2Q1_9PROT|nr:hypothetical protein [Aquisalinus luteolus]NHK28469.1 hypothetical protein [Aquisalinus luteolus]GGH98573.1 hypothetical protein GCM10011355_22480 [Aquisalinus luteolus]
MKIGGFLLILIGILIAAAPLASAMIAGSIAEANGCQLNEGGVNPCIIDGQDRGPLLSAMFLAGWYMIYTIPLGAPIILVGLILFVVGLFRKKKTS